MPPRDPEVFANAQAALRGTTFPSPGAVSSLLHFMCDDPVGGDIVITDDELVENFASRPASRAIHSLAPGVICKLLELAREPIAPTGRIPSSITIGPVTLEQVEHGVKMRWSLPRRRIWFVATPTRITILVRATFSDKDTATPALIERTHTMVEIEGGCPHCGVTVASYRELHHGGLVCGPCGRSFERSFEPKVTLPVARLVPRR